MKVIFRSSFLILLIFALQGSVNADSATADNKTIQNTVLLSSVTTNSQSEESEGFLLTIQLDETTLKTTGKLSLDLFCKNVLACPIYASTVYPPLEYHLELTDQTGKALPERRGFPFISAVRKAVFGPGTVRKSNWDLSMLFTIKNPGTYTLCAYRSVPRLDGNGMAKLVSNQISFTLTKDDIAANTNYWEHKLLASSSLRFRERVFGNAGTDEPKVNTLSDKK